MSSAAHVTPAPIASAQSVRFERLLPGPIERVWEYLTKPDLQRSWLAESAADIRDVTGCQPLRRLEYALRDSSVVSLELEARGSDVLLVLTHRRFPACLPTWLAGAGTALAVALLVFSFCRPDDAIRKSQGLGPSIVVSAAGAAPGLDSLRLKFPSSPAQPVYAMLGGRC
jgi:hypothetical protein